MFELTLRRREYLVESAPKKATKSVVDNLQKNDRLLVYHGTYNKEFEIMANGIDALRIRSRSYNQGNHNGLFVAPDMNTAARFGRIVLEMSLPVRSMHGPETWGGEISGKKGDDVWKDIYPKSFRPSLSASLSTRGEPQALYLGFVRPKDILGVYMMDSVNKPGPRMTLKEAKVRFKVEDVGVDLTNPRFSISDYVKMLKYPVAKIKAAILRYKPKSPDDIYDLIAGGGFGEHSFGEKALKNLVNQMYKQWVLLESRFRRRAYLVEATYKRDKDTRDRAEHFYDELVKVLEHSKQNLDKGIIRPWKNGFQINAGDFWRDPRAPKLIIALLPKSGGAMKGGLGKSGYFDVMIFPVLLEPGSLKHASTRLVKDYVVHEMIHLMDPGYGKNAGTRRYRVKGGEEGEVEPELYFNDPGEWNAFWQEGARMAESLLKGRMKDHPLFRQRFVGDGSLKEFRKHVSYYWDKEFLKYMDKKTERKFDKRFAEFWKQMKTEGLI